MYTYTLIRYTCTYSIAFSYFCIYLITKYNNIFTYVYYYTFINTWDIQCTLYIVQCTSHYYECINKRIIINISEYINSVYTMYYIVHQW